MTTTTASWWQQLHRPGAVSMAVLFATTTVMRALLITLVPLRALDYLGDAQSVSVLYFAVSVGAVFATLCVPTLVRKAGRRWVFIVGIGVQAACTPLLAAGSTIPFIVGLSVQVMGIAAADLCLNLFLLELVPRRELGRFEPLRLFYSGIGWTAGPWLGVVLWELTSWLPFALSALLAVVVVIHFKVLGLVDRPASIAHRQVVSNPIRYIPRFFSQPRLRLAWFLAFARSSWWTVFYIYAPIYLVASGAEESLSAAIVSAANGGMFLVRIWGRLGERIGMRRLLWCGFGLTSVATVFVTVMPSTPWPVAVCLLVSALAASVIDGVGNTPFLRAVRPFERPEMSAVFMTYRDTSQLAPPAFFAVVLRFVDLYSVFAISAAALMTLLPFIKNIPRRM